MEKGTKNKRKRKRKWEIRLKIQPKMKLRRPNKLTQPSITTLPTIRSSNPPSCSSSATASEYPSSSFVFVSNTPPLSLSRPFATCSTLLVLNHLSLLFQPTPPPYPLPRSSSHLHVGPVNSDRSQSNILPPIVDGLVSVTNAIRSRILNDPLHLIQSRPFWLHLPFPHVEQTRTLSTSRS
jgi:hypothetical protein